MKRVKLSPWLAALIVIVPVIVYLTWRSLSAAPDDTLSTIFESLKYLSLVVGGASGLIGAVTETKDKATGGPNSAGKWVIGIIAGSLFIGVISQVVESTIKKRQEDDARAKAEAQRKQLEGLVNTAQQTGTQLSGLVETAKDSIFQIKRLEQEQTEALANSQSILGDVKTVSSDVMFLQSQQQDALKGIENVSGKTETVSKDVLKTFDLTRRSSRPFRPSKIFLRLSYQYGTTSREFKDYVDSVRNIINEIEANERAGREDRRRDIDKDNWNYDNSFIHLNGPSFLTQLREGARAQRILTFESVEIIISSTRNPVSSEAANQTVLLGYATFRRNQASRPTTTNVTVPRPSNLEIIINRTTGDITQLFSLERIDVIEGLGIYSLYDLPGNVLDVNLPSYVRADDKPQIECLTYENDTLGTNGKSVDIITLESRRFEGPTDLMPSQSNQYPGVAFIYQLREDDFTSHRDCREEAKSVVSH